MKMSTYFMFREDNCGEMEYEASISSFQRDAEINNSYTGPESYPQDYKEIEANADMEVTSEATKNNEIDLTSQKITADTINLNGTNDLQIEETELTTGKSCPEHLSNAEATLMAVTEEDFPENSLQEFQKTPVSPASCEEIKNTDSDQITSDVESRQTENDSISTEPQAGGQIQEYQIQIARLEQENGKLIIEKKHITIGKDCLSHDIQMLNLRVSAFMTQVENQQVKPSTSTGSDKLPVEPRTSNIKPLGPAVNKPQPVHHSVTVNPWRYAATETSLASIEPMIMQPRSVLLLPNSQTSSTSSQSSMIGTSSNTTITVHLQQPQSVDISSSGGNSLDSSEANIAAQSSHLTSSTLVKHVEGSESTATVSDFNETTVATPPSILPLKQVIESAAAPSVTAVQINPAIGIALVVPQGRERVQTTVSTSQSQIDRFSVQNENGQAMKSSISNIASSSASSPSTKSEPSIVTNCTSELGCSSLDTTTHSNTQLKRKIDQLVTSYHKTLLKFYCQKMKMVFK